VIPVGWPVRQVLSAGDIVWLVGTVWLIAGAMRKPAPSEADVRPGRSEGGPSSTPEPPQREETSPPL
jgi:hypothetical protein